MGTGSGDTTLAGLLARPRVIAYDQETAGPAIDELSGLSAMRDPVIGMYKGWLLAVVASAAGDPIEVDRSLALGASPPVELTPAGRAWLIATAVDLLKPAQAEAEAGRLCLSWRKGSV